MTLREALSSLASFPRTEIFPVLFVGHGSPMHGIEDTAYAKSWKLLGEKLPVPKAILVISAHWLSNQGEIDISETQKTLYDFYGFPDELYRVKYEPSGSPLLAGSIAQGLSQEYSIKKHSRGLDHGAWIVLRRMYEKANIPVFQFAIDFSQGPEFHYALGKALIPLRERGVLILGSGNLVHNLGAINWEKGAQPFDWALEFDEKIRVLIERKDDQSLIRYTSLGRTANLAIPTPDHYFPFLYTLGASGENAQIQFPVVGIDAGSISMRSVLWEKY